MARTELVVGDLIPTMRLTLPDGQTVGLRTEFVHGDGGDAARLQDGAAGELPVASEPDGDLSGRVGLAEGSAGLLIADRYGQLYARWDARDPGGLPSPPAVEEWTRFLATQCPECGVLDQPATQGDRG